MVACDHPWMLGTVSNVKPRAIATAHKIESLLLWGLPNLLAQRLSTYALSPESIARLDALRSL